ncbi:MAG: polyprenyl synthetase family protein [Dehalococcoidia bacterium]
MALPDVFTRYRPAIDTGLRAALAGGTTSLYDMLRYHMGWLDEDGQPADGNSGKAVRPALCLFACEAAGGLASQALPAAVAVELVHNFSLIHDDIQDGDTERRHRPTVWYRWGHSHGLNAGDAMFVLGHQALGLANGDGLPPETALAVSRILTHACAEMIEGQVLDLSFEQRSTVCVDDYLAMIGKKTGALLECSLHMGSVIGCRDQAIIQAMRGFGKGLGLLFQVRDDMLGIWGAQDKTGKPAGSDIHRRKKSLPMVYAMEKVQGAARDCLVQIYRKDAPLTDRDIEDVLDVLNDLSTEEVCRHLAGQQAERSLAELDAVELSPAARRECEELTRFLLEREY